MKEDYKLERSFNNFEVKVIIDFLQHENKVDFSMHEHSSFEFHIIMSGNAELETDCDVFSFAFYLEKICSSPMFLQKRNKGNLKKIISLMHTGKSFSAECIKAHFMLILAEIFSCCVEGVSEHRKTTSSGEDDMRTLIIEEYFNEFCMKKINLKKLSKRLFLSEKQAVRIIKKSFGVSFRENLSKTRIVNAKKMLSETEFKIRDIAEICGYSSYNGFYLAFKEKQNVAE